MQRRVIVAGAGLGGVVAAMKLAQGGVDVTVLEKHRESELGLDQVDSMDLAPMNYAGIEIPERYIKTKIPLSFFSRLPDAQPLSMSFREESFNLRIDRKDFIKYLISLARKAGVNFEFGRDISAPLILGDRVVGVETQFGRVYADLVIDACGMNSPVRAQLPDFMLSERTVSKYDYLHAYRIYFKRVPGAPEPERPYAIYLWYPGSKGFNWVLSDDPEEVDVLLVSFAELEPEFVDETLSQLRAVNPHIGEEVTRPGAYHTIPLRQPLSVLVADGYAAVGDSAFMTLPFKGSGMGLCLMAGTMLAETVLGDKDGFYTAETLWEYQRRFFTEQGSARMTETLGKNILPYISLEDIDYGFKNGVLTQKDLDALGASAGVGSMISNVDLSSFIGKITGIITNATLRKALTGLVRRASKADRIVSALPEKYDREEVAKWQKRYLELFEESRNSDDTSVTVFGS